MQARCRPSPWVKPAARFFQPARRPWLLPTGRWPGAVSGWTRRVRNRRRASNSRLARCRTVRVLPPTGCPSARSVARRCVYARRRVHQWLPALQASPLLPPPPSPPFRARAHELRSGGLIFDAAEQRATSLSRGARSLCRRAAQRRALHARGTCGAASAGQEFAQAAAAGGVWSCVCRVRE